MARFRIDRTPSRNASVHTEAEPEATSGDPKYMDVAEQLPDQCIIAPDSVALPNSAGDGRLRSPLSPAEKTKQMEASCHTTSLPFVYDSPGEARDTIREVSETGRHGVRETSESARHTVAEVSRGNQFNAAQSNNASTDRANQDRFLAGQFTALGVQLASQEARLQKDNVDEAHWKSDLIGSVRKDVCDLGKGLGKDICDLSKDVLQSKFELATAIERNGRSTELAIEKTAAATMLSIEKTAAAALLDSTKNAAAAALCCCETEARIAASTAAVLAKLCSDQVDTLRQQLTVFQVRATAGTGSSPV